MRYRSRLLLWALVCALGPILVLGTVLRFQGRSNLKDARALRIQERVGRLSGQLRAEEARIDIGTNALVDLIRETPALRAEVAFGGTLRGDAAGQRAPSGDTNDAQLSEGPERTSPAFGRRLSLANEVGRVATLTGLDALILLSAEGTVLAASHFPGDVGRRDPGLVASGSSGEETWLADFVFPGGTKRVVLRRRPLELGNGTIWAVGASVIHSRWFGVDGGQVRIAEDAAAVRDIWPGGTSIPGDAVNPVAADTVVRVATLPGHRGVPWGASGPRALLVGFAEGDAEVMLRTWDRALVWAFAGAGVLAFVLGSWMSARLAAPVERLTQTARTVHLGRLTARFPESAGGEVGRLGRFLNSMLERLREGVEQLTEAERRATRGEIARQINHDIRNGLIPIRNVLSHMKEAREEGPESLARIFDERGGTLDGSLAYLSELADQYRGVAEHGTKVPVDVVSVVQELLSAPRFQGVGWSRREAQAWVAMDPVSFRRVMENLLTNALDAVIGDAKLVEVSVESGDDVVRVVIEDRGPGLSPEDQARAFEPFFSRKDQGTGLGLPIVRRLVSDVGGSVELDSAPGRGTRVSVVLAAVGSVDDPQRVPTLLPED